MEPGLTESTVRRKPSESAESTYKCALALASARSLAGASGSEFAPGKGDGFHPASHADQSHLATSGMASWRVMSKWSGETVM
jgi:hypothetical protein